MSQMHTHIHRISIDRSIDPRCFRDIRRFSVRACVRWLIEDELLFLFLEADVMVFSLELSIWIFSGLRKQRVRFGSVVAVLVRTFGLGRWRLSLFPCVLLALSSSFFSEADMTETQPDPAWLEPVAVHIASSTQPGRFLPATGE